MKSNSKCCKSFILGALALWVFYNALSYVVHHVWLAGDYQATASLWRSEVEMQNFAGAWLVYYAIIAAIVTCIFSMCCHPRQGESSCKAGHRAMHFGVKLGLLFGLMMGSAYLYMPIPLALGIKWFVAGFVQGFCQRHYPWVDLPKKRRCL